MVKRCLLLAVVFVGVACSSVAGQTQPAITAADLRQRLFLIADDSMMGRETGSEGAFKTSAYVAAEFRRLGLEPAGDSGTYFQKVPFWVVAVDQQSRLVTSGGAALQLGSDFLPVSFAVAPKVLDQTAIVFAGSVADTAHLAAASGLAGKFVVLDVPAGFDRRAIGPLLGRYREAATVGIVALDQLGSEQIARIREGRPVTDTSRNPRSILFVSHTGEEAGLLGSRWYSDHATVPIDSIVGEIDQDMIGRWTASDFPRGGTGAGSPTYLEVIGA